MHARQLAELASWVAIHSGNLIYGNQQQPIMVANHYWTASKIRVQRWLTTLKLFEQDIEDCRTGKASHLNWSAMEIVLQEIIVSEVLTRIWSAAVVAHDSYHRHDELHGLAQSVFLSHLEVKNRSYRLLLSIRADNEKLYDRMNVLRRRLERWTDLFLGQIPCGEQVCRFSFNPNRVKDFYQEQRQALGTEFENRQKVLAASFSADLLRDSVAHPANPDVNQKIAAGVLACFPSDRFDCHGLPKSIRLLWVEKAHQDTQMFLDHLIEYEVKVSRN